MSNEKSSVQGLTAFAENFKSGQVSATEYTEQCLGTIAEKNDHLQAFEYVEEQAIETAHAIDELYKQGTWLSPLMGVPVAIKDIFAVTNMPTTNGSLHPTAHLNGDEGSIVKRLRQAGCVIIGKTKTVEFALGATGVNEARGTPWNALDQKTHRIPGGSSSGSAVATATGMCGFALGTDTGGSVRIPACYNGLFGHKTTVGLWPTDGVFPLSPSLDSIGPITRLASDAALIHQVVTGQNVPRPPDLSTVKLGKPTGYFFEHLDDEVAVVIDNAVTSLQSVGVKFVEIEVPEAAERERLFPEIVPAELLSRLSVEGFRSAEAAMDSVTRERAKAGLDTDAITYLLAQERRGELERLAAEYMHGLNGWITPTCPGLPCAVSALADKEQNERALQSSRNTQPINLFKQCATTLPIAGSSASLPAGLQLVGSPNGDASLLSLSIAVEDHLRQAGLLFAGLS